MTAVISSESMDLDGVCTRGLFLCAVLLPSREINNQGGGNWRKKKRSSEEGNKTPVLISRADT